jgi:hypothetical protein
MYRNRYYSRGNRCFAAGSVGDRILKLSLGVIKVGKGSKEGVCNEGTGVVRETVLQNLSHIELPFCSVHPFSCSEITFQEMSAAQMFICSILAESEKQDITTFLAHTTVL